MLLFADDTTVLARRHTGEPSEQLLTSVLREWGLKPHPGKYERLGVDDDATEMAVRFLGTWRPASGHCDADFKQRMHRNRCAWSQLCRRLPECGLTEQSKAELAQACVISVNVFGCELRPMSKTTLRPAEVLWNKIVRGITWQRIRDMHSEHVTMANLRCRLGLHTVQHYIMLSTLSWLGRLARQPDGDITKEALRWALILENGPGSRPSSLRAYCWRLLRDVSGCVPSCCADECRCNC